MSDKVTNIVYWVTTGLFSLLMVFSAVQYLTNPEMAAGFTHLGYPGYFRVELAIAKFIGAAALLFPVRATLKEWAYAGFAIVLISACYSHIMSGDPAGRWMAPIIIGLIFVASYATYRKRG